MLDFIRDMDWPEWLIVGTLVLLLVGTGFAIYMDQKEWDQYSAQHHCKPTGSIAASNGYAVTGDGKTAVTYNPPQTIYVCDDGQLLAR